MAYKVPPFLKRVGDSLVFNQPGELVFYVPNIYFERDLAEIFGEYVELLGIFNYAIFNEKGQHSGLKTFKFPTTFTCKPRTIEKIKNVSLIPTSKSTDYRALHFYQGDEVITNVYCPQDLTNIDRFLKMYMTGKLPNTIPADTLQDYFVENAELAGVDYGVSMALFGVMFSESLRSYDDPKVLFRHTDMKDMTSYSIMPIKDIPKNISPYTALTSENWMDASTAAMSIESTRHVPMEKLMV